MVAAGGMRTANKGLQQPTVSIITVVFNAAALLTNFLKNVTPYLSADVELLVIDGQSTDGTIEILKRHSHIISYWRSEPDGGIYDAMNKAVNYAQGKWLYFIGTDDVLLGGFAKAVKLLINPNYVYFGKVVVAGEIWGKPFKKYQLTKMDICHQSVFYPAGVFKTYHYEPKYKVYADQYLNLQTIADKRYQWVFIDELLAIYDTRGYSASIKDNAYEQDYPAIVKKNLGWWVYLRYRYKKHKQSKKQHR